MKYSKIIKDFLEKKKYSQINLKAALFDMDGVLYDSMKNHAVAWCSSTKAFGVNFNKEDAYLHEGRTRISTINWAYQRQYDRDATEEEIENIYELKESEYNKFPDASPMIGTSKVLEKIKENDLTAIVVTGSSQESLLDRLENDFPNTFQRESMVTAFDVKHGKPHPEPYLMALKKGEFKPQEAIVIENAPLGVESAVAAGIFTIAVNTGPLDDQILLDAGANLLFHSMESLANEWEKLYNALNETKI
ncbi:MAG: HAD-IA family hydrolase [Bacteroides sp.]|nr:HAD-IA family hydrolase [Bacteroides sp.]